MSNSTLNQRNFALESNAIFGSTLFGTEVSYAIQTFTIPGITFSNPRLTKRGLPLYKQGDTLSYSDLNVNLILDSDLEIWREILNKAYQMVNPKDNSSTDTTSEGWIDIYSSNSEFLFQIQFHNIILSSIGEVNYQATGTDNELTLPLTFNYSTYNIK